MTTSAPASTATAATAEQARDAQCFADSQAARGLMDLATTPRFTLNPTYAVGKALHTVTTVSPFRSRLAALPEYDIASYDLLETYARALRHVDTEVVRHVQRLSEVPALTKEGAEVRSMLFDYASVVSRKGGIAPEVLSVVRQGTGARDIVADLNVLVKELTNAPAGTIGDATPVTFADLDRATTLAHELQRLVGNPAGDTVYDELLGERQKLGALLVRSQDQVRRGMSFLRWDEDDGSELVPSLYVTGSRSAQPQDGGPAADVVAVHDQLHHAGDLPLDPEDNPFTTED